MNPFEFERLGWEESGGCRSWAILRSPRSVQHRLLGRGEGDEELEEVEAIGEPVRVGAPAAPIERPEFPV